MGKRKSTPPLDLRGVCAEWVKELGDHYVWEPYANVDPWLGWVRCKHNDGRPALLRAEVTRLCIIDPLIRDEDACHVDRESIAWGLPDAFERAKTGLLKAHKDGDVVFKERL